MTISGRVVVAAAVVSLALASCGSTEGLLGQELYERSCQTCHMADGSGGTGKAIGSGSEAVSLTDDQIAGVVRAGPGVMPSFPRLTDEQVSSLVEHIRQIQKGEGG